MQSRLVLRSPAHGTGWRDTWVFSGNDDRLLRECLNKLDDFIAPERADRWTAAMVFEENPPGPADAPALGLRTEHVVSANSSQRSFPISARTFVSASE
jgi:hypothetical protein